MKKLKDVLANAARPEISLTKLVGESIIDIEGYVDSSMGVPFFRIRGIRFADGRTVNVDVLNAGDGSGPIAILDENTQDNVISPGQLDTLESEIYDLKELQREINYRAKSNE